MPRKLTTLLIAATALLAAVASPSINAAENPPADRHYKLVTNIQYREGAELSKDMHAGCRLDVYYPDNVPGFATVVWFHGGGLTEGHRSVPEKLKQQKLAVVAVDYRLSPQVHSPAYVEDAAAAVAWVFKHVAEYGGTTNRIYLSGHSAGGYLAAMIGLDKHWLAASGVDANQIAGIVPFSGQAITHFTIRAERGISNKQPIVDEMAPLYHVRADAPPLVLITGDRDLELLGRYEENALLWRMMKLTGHQSTTFYELQGFNHGEMASPSFDILLRFIKKTGQGIATPGR